MLKTARALGATPCIGMALALGLAGCAQVLGVEPWTEQPAGTGGAGQGGTQSASVGTGGQGGTQSSSVGTGGQGGTQSATVGTGGQGGGTTAKENCTNGTDDDNDGHVDCADAECTSYACVPPVPGDWQGYVMAYVGPAPQQEPACSAGWMSQKSWYGGTISALPATCGCGCDPSTGGQCYPTLGDDEFTLYNDASCVNFLAYVTPAAVNQCTLLSTGSITRAGVSFQGQTPASGGTCISHSLKNTPPPTFDNIGLTCEDPLIGGGCTNSKVCVPVPEVPFKDTVCIYKFVPDPTLADCPTGFYKFTTLYGDIVDTRDCTACSCGSPSGQKCPMSATVYSGTSCATPIATLPGDGTCAPTGLMAGTATSYKLSMGPPGGGQCAPSNATPTGEVYGGNPAVVCCVP